MQGATVRINAESREVLKKIAGKEHASMQSIIQRAIEAYRRERFLAESNAAFAALKMDKKAWKEEIRERKEWDTTNTDSEIEDD